MTGCLICLKSCLRAAEIISLRACHLEQLGELTKGIAKNRLQCSPIEVTDELFFFFFLVVVVGAKGTKSKHAGDVTNCNTYRIRERYCECRSVGGPLARNARCGAQTWQKEAGIKPTCHGASECSKRMWPPSAVAADVAASPSSVSVTDWPGVGGVDEIEMGKGGERGQVSCRQSRSPGAGSGRFGGGGQSPVYKEYWFRFIDNGRSQRSFPGPCTF